MKIGFISDTHGYFEHASNALEILGNCDTILHLGDVLAPGPKNGIQPGYDPMALATLLAKKNDIVILKGNCDADVDEDVMQKKFLANQDLFFKSKELRVYASHGYIGSVEERVEKAREMGANVVAVGHIHIKKFEIIDGMIYLCPGSAAVPKDGTRSCVVYEDEIFIFYDVDTKEVIRTVPLPKSF